MRKSAAFILVLFVLFVTILTGCTTENHRIIITVKNNRDTSQRIELHIDGTKKYSALLDPAESVEWEFELSKNDHTFDLYHEVEGTYELYKTETFYVESDSSLFFELE